MANIASWLQGAYLDWCLLGANPTRPSAIYAGLASASPTATTSYELQTSVGYARQPITFRPATNGRTYNNLLAVFGPFTTPTAVIGLQLWDSGVVAEPNMLWYGTFSKVHRIGVGDYLAILPDAVEVHIS